MGQQVIIRIGGDRGDEIKATIMDQDLPKSFQGDYFLKDKVYGGWYRYEDQVWPDETWDNQQKIKKALKVQ